MCITISIAITITFRYQQSPPYSNQTAAAGYSSALTGAATQAAYEQLQYKQQAVYDAQAASAAAQVAQAQAQQQQQQQQQAQQQAQAQQVQAYQHKKDIIDNYSSGGNRLQANVSTS